MNIRTRRRIFTGALCLLILLLLLPGRALASEREGCYPPCAGTCQSLVDGLISVGADASFEARTVIAGANGISDYRGEAGQNIALLKLLKQGLLRRPAPLAANLNSVAFLRQEPKTCKATAAAMALNLLLGRDEYSTADLGGSCCCGIGGQEYRASDGRTYRAVYRTDRYEGSLSELTGALDEALAAGLPAIAAVHSLRGGTRHHWVLVLGRSGSDYRIADPARKGGGSIGENAVTMADAGYTFGLADYETLHYGYVTFEPIDPPVNAAPSPAPEPEVLPLRDLQRLWAIQDRLRTAVLRLPGRAARSRGVLTPAP